MAPKIAGDTSGPAAFYTVASRMLQSGIERKTHLKKLITKTAIQFSESFEVDGPEMFAHSCAVGLEGVVSKVRDSRYPAGRGNGWVKTPARSARLCRLPASR
jgi:ATP-dependent DNA ligase